MQDYFRDVTQEDVQMLLSAHTDPLGDPLFKVPPCGRVQQVRGSLRASRAQGGLLGVALGFSRRQ